MPIGYLLEYGILLALGVNPYYATSYSYSSVYRCLELASYTKLHQAITSYTKQQREVLSLKLLPMEE